MGEKGFTLVELCLALIIINLLAGGILIAESMRETAKIQSTVGQIQLFDTAVIRFKAKYKQLPGDNDFFGAPVGSEVHGDGRIIEDDNGLGSGRFDAESGRFWYDLSQTGLENPNGNGYADCDTIGLCDVKPGVNVPKSAVGKNAVFYPYTGAITVYYLGAATGGAAHRSIHLKPGLTGLQAEAIDRKIDDGIGNSGYITHDWHALSRDTATADPNCLVPSGDAYNVAMKGNICSLFIQIGTTTGTAANPPR